MKFWDNVKRFAQPYGEEDYGDYDDAMDQFDEEEPKETESRSGRRTSPFSSGASATQAEEPKATASTASSGFSSQSVNLGGSGKQEVVLFHAKSLDDAAKAATELRKRRAVILNMENVDKTLIRRVVDFLSGSVYALDGSVRKIAQATYLFCPHNMDVVGDLETIQADADSFF